MAKEREKRRQGKIREHKTKTTQEKIRQENKKKMRQDKRRQIIYKPGCFLRKAEGWFRLGRQRVNGPYQTRQGKIREDKTKQDKTRQNETFL